MMILCLCLRIGRFPDKWEEGKRRYMVEKDICGGVLKLEVAILKVEDVGFEILITLLVLFVNVYRWGNRGSVSN